MAAVVAALTTFLAMVQDRTTVDTMGRVEWLIVVVSSVVAGLTVYLVPNKPKVP